MDRRDIRLRELDESKLVSLENLADRFDENFVYINSLVDELVSDFALLLNHYYGVEKSLKFWETLLISELREVCEVVYYRYLQLNSVDGSVEVDLIESSKKYLSYPSARLFYLNLNFNDSVDFALSSFIIENSDLKNRFHVNYLNIVDKPIDLLPRDKEYFADTKALEMKRIIQNKGSVFPQYRKFYGNPNSLFVGNTAASKKLISEFVSGQVLFEVYTKGVPLLKRLKQKLLFNKLKYLAQYKEKDSFRTFIYLHLSAFLPTRIFELDIPSSSNLRYLTIAMPGGTVDEAESRENGGLSFAIQHGTGYGIYKHGTQEWVERRATDGFISWGWTGQTTLNTDVIPMPSPILSEFLHADIVKKREKDKKVFLGIIFNQTYSRVGRFLQIAMPYYLQENLKLLNSLLTGLVELKFEKEIVLSEYAYEQGILLKEQLDHDVLYSKDIQFKPMVGDILVKNCDLIISNSFGTSFFERIVMNEPILILNHFFKLSDYSVNWQRLVDKMIQLGIYHQRFESYQLHLEEIHGDIHKWWKCNEIQNLVKEIQQEFCLVDSGWIQSFMQFIAKKNELMLGNLGSIKVPMLIKFYSRIYHVFLRVVLVLRRTFLASV